MRVHSSEAISGFLKVYRLGRSFVLLAKAWQEAAARGSHASSCLPTSHFGPTPAQADNCILHYYNWLGDIARQIAAGAPHQHRYGQGSRRCVRVAGGDELIFIRATASPGQLELLADAVL